MRFTIIVVALLIGMPAAAQEGCISMVARWETPGHPLNVAEYRLYQREGTLLLETTYEDGSGIGDLDQMRKTGDVLRYVTKRTLDLETLQMVAKPYEGQDFFKLPGGAIELWDEEGRWLTAAATPVCWRF